MNVLKIQQELLKSLVKAGKGSYFHDGDGRVFVTACGRVGYFINEEDLHLNLHGAQVMMPLDLDDIVCPANLLIGTDEYRVGGAVRKYHHDDVLHESTYVDTSLLGCFDSPRLYQDEDPLSIIVVTEDIPGDTEWHIVGVITPYKMKENN